MEQEFKLSIGFRLFYGIVLLAVIIFFSGLAFVIPQHNNLGGFLLVVAIVVPCIMMLINVFVSKVTISAQSINRRTLFGSKELLCADVKGCRIGEKVIYIDAVDGTRASGIVVNNYIDFAGSSDLKNWLAENFPDLNGLNLQFEREKLLQNPKYGTTEQERKDTLKKARTIAIIYNAVGFLLMFAMIPVDNGRIAVLILMGYPLLGIVIMVSSRGLTKFVSSGKISVNPFVMLGFVWPAVMMLFKSLDGFTIYHYTDTFLPCLLITLGLFAMLYGWGLNRSLQTTRGQVIIMLLASYIYSYGSTMQLNCVFDQSVPKVYQTTVYNKRVNHGKSTTYYLTLNPWGNDTMPEDISVGRRQYNSNQIGDTVSVATKPGLLHIPWFYLSQ